MQIMRLQLIIAMLFVSYLLHPQQGPTHHSVDAVTNAQVTFSADESQVKISYAKGTWTFFRPVVLQESWMKTASNPFGGHIYWVSQDGLNRFDGIPIAPFASIQSAIDAAQPGDIVYVNPGTYVEHIDIKKSGLVGKPIVISAAPGTYGQVRVMNPQDYYMTNVHAGVMDLMGKYVWVNGFVIEGSRGKPGSPVSETFASDGITWWNETGLGSRATNNVVYNNLHCGLKGGTAIDMTGNIVFENGTQLTDHGIYATGDNTRVIGNIIFNNSGFGIHSYDNPQNQDIERNIIFGHRWAAGIILAGANNRVYQNDVVDNKIGILYFRGGSYGNVVENNIIAFNGINAAPDNDTHDNFDDYNIYIGGSDYGPSGISDIVRRKFAGAHEIIRDPMFVDRVHGDFRLMINSPAIAQGKPISGLANSGAAPDIGAFKFTVQIRF